MNDGGSLFFTHDQLNKNEIRAVKFCLVFPEYRQ